MISFLRFGIGTEQPLLAAHFGGDNRFLRLDRQTVRTNKS
jgi:hypothetical protein